MQTLLGVQGLRSASISMVQSADLGNGDHLALRRRLEFTRIRRVPSKRQMRS